MRHPDFHENPSRRMFLRGTAASAAALRLGMPAFGGLAKPPEVSVILLFLVGGPSHLDTWDMKPDAPDAIRGPFRPVATRVPGVTISEIFPKTALLTDKIALVRSLHHDDAAVHDTGHQLLQTGRLCAPKLEHPHFGSVFAHQTGLDRYRPANYVLPGPIGLTGGNMPHGQSGGFLGKAYDPVVLDPETVRCPAFTNFSDSDHNSYGGNRFGQSCLMARRLIQRGARIVTVNMYDTVFNETTWDAHGAAPFSTLDSYRDSVGPTFDTAYSALITDLDRRGLLETTMVLAVGEFGRTPRINRNGGRDHHPGCWTALFAGGPVQGGRVIGASDATGEAPSDRPVTPAEVAATVYKTLGLSLDSTLPGPNGEPIRIVDKGVEPIHELF